MKMRICPFCREKIKCQAVVCRYCRRDLPALPPRKSMSAGWFAAFLMAAVMMGGTALLTSEYLKERQYWLKEQD